MKTKNSLIMRTYNEDTLLTNFENDMRPFVEKVLAKFGDKDIYIVDDAFAENGITLEDCFSLHAIEMKDCGKFWELYESMFAALPDEEVPKSHKFIRNIQN